MTEIVIHQTPPMLHGPSEKERKYDRQLRLWAANGQAALESANILLLNSGSGTVGVETLKNLVLPGVGRFTIIDEAMVTEADLGVNFFLDHSCLGRPRAECCAELLLELNPEVHGDWYPKSNSRPAIPTTGSKKLCVAGTGLDGFDLKSILGDMATFTMILYTLPIKDQVLELVQEYGHVHKTPIVSVQSAGFYSYFQVNLPGVFPVVDTHPDDTAKTDLRVLTPWDNLVDFCRKLTANMDIMNDDDHSHIPFVAILVYYLEEWRKDHDGKNPSTYKEKLQFRDMVEKAMRTKNAEGGEENFEEARAAVLKTISEDVLPPSLKQVFEYQDRLSGERGESGKSGKSGEAGRSTFWVVAEAINVFYARHGTLPVPGNIPDMKAKSAVYVELQNIYKAKAREDVAEVMLIAQAMPGRDNLDQAEVELFCKNAAFVKLINPTRVESGRMAKVAESELADEMSLMPVFLALSATANGEGASVTDILAAVDRVVPGASEKESTQLAAHEVFRAGGAELHNISAVTGGMVAQEMIKIITKQYVPIDNTCIFDGIRSRCQELRL